MIESIITHPDFWLYAGIPLTSAFVGWFTNVVAIKMMFYPVEFWGIPPYLGWQGVIPSKASKMAGITVRIMVPKLISIEEIFARIDPRQVAESMRPSIRRVAEQIVQQVMEEHSPRLWEMVPVRTKEDIYTRIKENAPEHIASIMSELKDNISDLFDLKALVTDTLVANKPLMNEMFQKCGEKEFIFIARSGIYFGFLFGLIQMGIWIYYKPWWLLPLAGAFVGYATNWLALEMIFTPINPIRIGPFKIQGLFLKRQKEVSAEYARISSTEILSAQKIFDAIVEGPRSEEFTEMVRRHVKDSIDKGLKAGKVMLQMVLGTQEYLKMKNHVGELMVEELPKHIHHIHPYTHQAMDIENTLRDKMQALSSKEFERVLHPVFEEDEWILIAVGAVLGMFAGIFQLLFIFVDVVVPF